MFSWKEKLLIVLSLYKMYRVVVTINVFFFAIQESLLTRIQWDRKLKLPNSDVLYDEDCVPYRPQQTKNLAYLQLVK